LSEGLEGALECVDGALALRDADSWRDRRSSGAFVSWIEDLGGVDVSSHDGGLLHVDHVDDQGLNGAASLAASTASVIRPRRAARLSCTGSPTPDPPPGSTAQYPPTACRRLSVPSARQAPGRAR
jgi:hypothetical protein